MRFIAARGRPLVLEQPVLHLQGVAEKPLRIDPLEIKLIGPSNPIAQDVLAILRRAPGPRVSPIRWRGTRLGNVSVEGAYLYPLPVTTP